MVAAESLQQAASGGCCGILARGQLCSHIIGALLIVEAFGTVGAFHTWPFDGVLDSLEALHTTEALRTFGAQQCKGLLGHLTV
jgi:hypothetical protein